EREERKREREREREEEMKEQIERPAMPLTDRQSKDTTDTPSTHTHTHTHTHTYRAPSLISRSRPIQKNSSCFRQLLSGTHTSKECGECKGRREVQRERERARE